jgi:steroid delta-isomerase-like uncharacterized protein
MSENNKQLVRRWFEEVWNKGNANAIDEMFAADGIAHGLNDDKTQPLTGPAGFKKFHAAFRESFPDIRVEVHEILSEGDLVAARCSVTGSHQGNSLGIAASNRPVELSGIAMVRVRDGKIVEGWNNFDFMTMYRQIGAI